MPATSLKIKREIKDTPKRVVLSSILFAMFVDIKVLNSIIATAYPSFSGEAMTIMYIVIVVLLISVAIIFRGNNASKTPISLTLIVSFCILWYFITKTLVGEPSVELPYFFVFTISAFIIPCIIKYDVRLLLLFILILPSWGIFYLMQLFYREIEEFGVITMGTSYGLLIPVIANIVYVFFYYSEDCLIKKIFLLPFFACNLLYLVQLAMFGSRGPIASLVFMLIVFWIISLDKYGRLKINRIRVFAIITILPILIIFFVHILSFLSETLSIYGLSLNVIEKFLTLEGAGDMTNGRDNITKIAINGIIESPLFGYGFAQFENNTGIVYPHNFVLQLLYDGGIILTSIILFPVLGHLRLKFLRHNRDEIICILFFLFASVPGALFSGDVWKASILWIFFGASLSSNNTNIRKL